MQSRRDVLKTAAGLSLALPFIGKSAFAQEVWPNRQINAICGLPAGSGADILTRFYARKLQETIGKPVIVENKLGAFGITSIEHIVRSKPDGYTIGIAPGFSMVAAAPSLVKNLSFDPVKDLDHVTTLCYGQFLLTVAGNSPYKTAGDLVQYLKAQGDKASYASVANSGLISSELFKSNFELQTVEVKYRDATAALNEMSDGKIAFMHADPLFSSGHLASGRLRALATSGSVRLKNLPNVPSAKEAGITNAYIEPYFSVHAAKGTPKPILERLEKACNEIAVADDTVQFLAKIFNDPYPGNAALITELITKDTVAWREYARLAKIEPAS